MLLFVIVRNYIVSDSFCNFQCMMEDFCQCGFDVVFFLLIICIQDCFIFNGKLKLVRVFNVCLCMDDCFDGFLYFVVIWYLCENSVSCYDIFLVFEDDLFFCNIYCFLCNSQFEIIDDKFQILLFYSVYGVSVECFYELNIFYFISFIDIILMVMFFS